MFTSVLAVVALRLFNPNDVAIDATLRCGSEVRAVQLAAHELRDVEGCHSGESLVPLLALQAFVDDEGREWQQVAGADECGAAAIAAPLFACRNGVATAYVAPVPDATYAWSASGASITAGAATARVTLQLGEAETVTLTCRIVTAECTRTATAVIAVREPIVVKSLEVPATANTNEPLTLSWQYEPGGEPASQMLAGDLFAEPVGLPGDVRSYIVTPHTEGTRTVELRASYARAVTAKKRRRRAMSGGPAASECPSASATARVDVKGCAAQPVIQAPDDVRAGELFTAKMTDLAAGEQVEWTAVNGTISSTSGNRVVVIAGAEGKVEVLARVERGLGCFAVGRASVAIIQPREKCPVIPTADLSLVSDACDRAVVRAELTGTPPFAGRWSDGHTFRTTATFVEHDFLEPGVHGLTDFRDASCFGYVYGEPEVAMVRPSVQLTGVAQTCGGGEVTATFTGTPPFQGKWSDGQAFKTGQTTLTRTVPAGTWSVGNLTDAACSTLQVTSNEVTFGPERIASVEPRNVCYIPEDSYFFPPTFRLKTTGGEPPYVYEFTDGHVLTTNAADVPYQRYSEVHAQPWQLKRATANGCQSTLGNAVTVVWRRVGVHLDGTPINACTATNVTIASLTEPSPGSRIEWSVLRESGLTPPNPVIVSGEGTPAITIRSAQPGRAEVIVRTRWEGFCRYDRSPGVRVTFAHCDGGKPPEQAGGQ